MLIQVANKTKCGAGASWLGQVGESAILPRSIPNGSTRALQKIKVNKAVGPDTVPAWVLRDNASTLAALFNTSLQDGVIPALLKTAHVIPLPKKQPPRWIEEDIRPISLTPIVSKIFESIVMK